MDRAAFEALISRMEALASSDPAAYRRRVYGLALLGYGFLLALVLVLLALCLFFIAALLYLKVIAIKLVFVFGAPSLMVLRAMWVRLEVPAGERLTREATPALFEMLDELRRQLKTPPLHRVLLTSDFNAGVMQVPRLGLLGWHRNYLFIGLPLIKSLTVEQFRSVLAHELGHLSRGHARAGNWIYRLRLIWQRLESAFSETPHWGAAPVRAFFRWYLPRFSATSFPLARANEYEADAAAAQLTSARSAAQALTAVSIVGTYLSEKYWPRIHSAARELPQPSFAPYSEFIATAISEVPPGELRDWQNKALAARTSYGDTHPSLADRLRAMGVEAQFAPPTAGNGAERLLGAELARLEGSFDEQWRERIAAAWKQVHENTRRNRTRIAQLRAEASQGELEESRALELADLEEEVGEGPLAALAMRRSLVARFPSSLRLRFALARQLLQADDPEGIPQMEALLNRDPAAILPGAELLRDFHWRRGDMALSARWHETLCERAAEEQAAQRERERIHLADTFVGHRLSEEARTALLAQLKLIPELRRVYLVRKLTRHAETAPLLVLGFRTCSPWSFGNTARTNATLQQIRQEIVFPAETLIVGLDGGNSAMESRLRRVRGSRLL
jgi:Zn-dependent protease with chaperone function